MKVMVSHKKRNRESVGFVKGKLVLCNKSKVIVEIDKVDVPMSEPSSRIFTQTPPPPDPRTLTPPSSL
jgi:hypothetical protein